MTRTEAFEKIKALLFKDEKKFEQAKLEDGNIIQWEGELAEGVALFVVGEDGNLTPAPDGTHTTDEGMKVTTVGGLVTMIEKEIEDKKSEPEMASEFEKAFAAHVEVFSGVVKRVEDIEVKLREITDIISKSTSDTESKFNSIVKLVEEIAEQPLAENDKPANKNFKKVEVKRSAADLINDYLNKK